MPRESHANRLARAGRIFEALRKAYPDAHCELNYRNPLELLIATILSAQCSDKQVNKVTETLFRKYRSAEDYANAPLDELERDIQRIGLFRAKAKNIQSCCRQILANGGSIPDTMEGLTQLSGVGRKTANVVLGNAFHKNVGVVVDTHVARLSQRLRLADTSDPVRIEQSLMALFPAEHWTLLSHLLIFHGRRRCAARRPDCPNCEVATLCPSRGRAV
jgi:endonuclease-3